MPSSNESFESPPVTVSEEGDYGSLSIPHRPLAGNTADDDGQALDQFFESMALGPQVYGQPRADAEALPPIGRTISRTINLDNYAVGEPVLLLPADSRRDYLHLEGFSPDLFFVDQATYADGSTTIVDDISVNTLAPVVVILQTTVAATGGTQNLSVSADDSLYLSYASRAMTATGTTITTITNPLRYLRVNATGVSVAGTHSVVVSQPRTSQRYAWAESGLTATSMSEVVGSTDFAGYTGPVYVCKTVDEPTSVTAWAVTY